MTREEFIFALIEYREPKLAVQIRNLVNSVYPEIPNIVGVDNGIEGPAVPMPADAKRALNQLGLFVDKKEEEQC